MDDDSVFALCSFPVCAEALLSIRDIRPKWHCPPFCYAMAHSPASYSAARCHAIPPPLPPGLAARFRLAFWQASPRDPRPPLCATMRFSPCTPPCATMRSRLAFWQAWPRDPASPAAMRWRTALALHAAMRDCTFLSYCLLLYEASSFFTRIKTHGINSGLSTQALLLLRIPV